MSAAHSQPKGRGFDSTLLARRVRVLPVWFLAAPVSSHSPDAQANSKLTVGVRASADGVLEVQTVTPFTLRPLGSAPTPLADTLFTPEGEFHRPLTAHRHTDANRRQRTP